MNEYYGVSPSSDFFMHYGIKGMKWGVRKFAENEYAKPSDKYSKLYGDKSNTKIHPLIMQHHLNQLNKSYSNIAAKKRGKEIEISDHDKALWLAKKRQKKNPKAMDKYNKIMSKLIEEGVDKTIQARNIEKMMEGISTKAVKNNYSISSKNVTRFPYVMIRGRGISVIPVGGQKIKIRKKHKG